MCKLQSGQECALNHLEAQESDGEGFLSKEYYASLIQWVKMHEIVKPGATVKVH